MLFEPLRNDISFELRRATLRQCRQYLEKVNAVRAMAEDLAIMDNENDQDDSAELHNDGRGESLVADESESKAGHPAAQASARESSCASTDPVPGQTPSPPSMASSLPSSSRHGPAEENTPSKDVSDQTNGRTHHSTRTPAQSLASSSSSTSDTQLRLAISRAELHKCQRLHASLEAIVSHLGRGLARQDQADRCAVNDRWEQAQRSRGREPVRPGAGRRRAPALATWRGDRSALREVCLDGDLLWEEEVERARLESGIWFKKDGLGRRVLKI